MKLKEDYEPFLDDMNFEDELEFNAIDGDILPSKVDEYEELYTDTEPSDTDFSDIIGDSEYDHEYYGNGDFYEDDMDVLEEMFKNQLVSTDDVICFLKEGGPRKNMTQDTIDSFVHQLLLIKDPTRRQEVVNEIFEKIKDENQKAFEKTQTEVKSAETEVKEELKETKLRESAVELKLGFKAKFQKSKSEPGEYDLLLSNGKDRYVCESAAWYTEGYDQGSQGGNKMKYYVKTIFGFGDGNGSGKSSKSIPDIKYVKYLEQFINEDIIKKLYQKKMPDEISGKSSSGRWIVRKV